MVAKFFVHKLTYRFGSHEALRDVTLEIPPNQITVVFGPSPISSM